MKVLIMGLGLHGGGLESARYLLRQGADITVTDLQDEAVLAPSIAQLESSCREAGRNAQTIRYVLGRHETADFKTADMVLKSPGVRSDAPYLQAARRIETDISLFLTASPARLTAVTGSKGKSGTASAIHWVLTRARGTEHSGFQLPGAAWLGGNITVSPLSFLDRLHPADDVVLELSSWQLGDLRGRRKPDGAALLKPAAAAVTAIMPDHLDHYGTMEAYIADKRVIYQGQDENDVTIAADDTWGLSFHAESRGLPLVYSHAPLDAGTSGGWLCGQDGPGLARGERISLREPAELVPVRPSIPGYHQKQNLLVAGLVLLGLGLPPDLIREELGTFPGIEHRLELFHTAGGIAFYNDSAATIPEAAAAALEALGTDAPLTLITGGMDKNLDFSPLVKAAVSARRIILLAGTGSEKLKRLFDAAGIEYQGPFDSLEQALTCALETAANGHRIVLSPGCASFGMFRNEFDRGRRWKEAVLRLAG